MKKGTQKQHTILVVDDEVDNLNVIRSTLMVDYEVLVANSAFEALEILKDPQVAESIHLIISDQRMPKMTGVEFLKETISLVPRAERMILTGFTEVNEIISSINEGQICQFITKPISHHDFLAVIKRALVRYELEERNIQLMEDVKRSNAALQKAMRNLHLTKITNGVYWLQIPEADLYILCGCPADAVKHMIRKGFIATITKNNVSFESGPNAILLCDNLLQKGEFSNLAEFPVLQMLYMQGMIIPNHPNNKGFKPVLIGCEKQVKAQLEYIYRGNYGLTSLEEIMETGVPQEEAERLMRIKMKFAFGKIRPTEDLLDSVIADSEPVEIRNGVFVKRVGVNQYEFQYKGKSTVVDLNLGQHETYEAPYQLNHHHISHEFFAILHIGEGDGWDYNRPCMGSILMYQGDIYLIDAGPNILSSLRALGININEIRGIFHTHGHDDHFAGLPVLMQANHRIKYYATPLVKASVSKKLSALISMEESEFSHYFDFHELEVGVWNNIEGLEVKPFYSPHPVETNTFVFRALGAEGYRTYGHWADLTSFAVLDKMIEEDPSKPGMTKAYVEQIKAEYLLPVDLKKVDVDGGMIHGEVMDYANDPSEKIILAHTSTDFTPEQKEVGSEASFATLDVMIPKHQNYLRKQAAEYLQEYFSDLSINQLRMLLNSPTDVINPGTIVLAKGTIPENVYLILSGTVEYIRSELDINFNISTGSIIGDTSCLKGTPLVATYRSVTHVQVLRLSGEIFKTFLEFHDLLDHVIDIQKNIEFLRKTRLLGEGLSYLVQNKIAQKIREKTLAKNEVLDLKKEPGLYLLHEGELCLKSTQNDYVETLKMGGFCGEQSILEEPPLKAKIQATQPTKVYFIEPQTLLNVPIVHWKLLEMSASRKSKLELL